jgi:Xaa-Pro aminopeptidase
VVRKLEECRRETGERLRMPLRDISFDTISGAGPNGAVVHYRVTEKTNRKLARDELFLLDSGGQYDDATTDVTRTLIAGEPSAEMRERFTLVLKGMIAISRACFPRGTRGMDIDVLARQAMWQRGLDYAHGTGHGVGSYLSVHEGPQNISKRGTEVLQPGMILSNEPGYYKQGAYGIRIENLVLVSEAKAVPGGDIAMLGFETLTLCPIDRRLIDITLLDAGERAWLDAYHARVLSELGPLVDASVLPWLEKSCAPLEASSI